MIVIFNGPPGSGKDKAADFFKSRGFKHLSFKYQLFKETIAYFGVDTNWFMDDYDNREVKERPENLLNGMSRREALIHVSENIIKPKFGKDIFGVYVAKEINASKNYCVSDGGFIEEIVPIINRIGTDEIVLVQLTREGYDFSTDSRRYFDGQLIEEYVINFSTPIISSHILPKKFPIRTYRVHNNGTLEDFYKVLTNIHEKEIHEQTTTKRTVFVSSS